MSHKSKLIILTLVLFSLPVFGFSCKKNTPAPAVNPLTVEQQKQEAQRQQEKKQFNDAMKKTYDVDKDFDGIIDTEEAKLGTDPNNADTDSDGLLDSSEVNIYKTDPLKADTDGDGLNDGYEVQRGLSPTSSNKIK